MDESCDFKGWATRYNVRCSDGRTIKPNAFVDDDGLVVPLVWNHGHKEANNVLGHALLSNRPEGVRCEGYCNNTPEGARAKEMIKHGDITALSIWANNLTQNKRSETDKDVLHGNIREVSLVLAGANPGAYIDSVLCHSEDGEVYVSDTEAIFYNDGAPIELMHSDDFEENDEFVHADEEEGKMSEENKASEESEKDDRTIQDVLDTMTEEQLNVLKYLVGSALEEGDEEKGDEMSHNIFDGSDDGAEETIEHALGMDCDMETAIKDMRRYGSIKQSFLAHGANLDELVGEDVIVHAGTAGEDYGIKNIDYLFPDYQTTTNTPSFVKRNTEWVSRLMNAVSHTPFSRVKSVFANITADEARARGYIKGKQKKEEVFPLLKRTTDPQTVYKKQKLDRDDIIDITSMDVVSWLRQEMRMMLDEEIARAILIGDGRNSGDDDKISEDHIRSILNDDPFYSIKVTAKYGAEPDKNTFAADLEENVIYAFEDYEGAGNPLMFTTQRNLNILLMQKDQIGRRIYKTKQELCAALGVSDIVPVQVMKNLKRTPNAKETDLTGKTTVVDAVIVNPSDYNVGTDKGGSIAMFDDFDIDYNQEKYLIETRLSGALTVPYSAIVVDHCVDTSFATESAASGSNVKVEK